MIALILSPMPYTKGISLADLLSMTYIENFAQQHPTTQRNIPLGTFFCFSTAAAAAAPSASHPRRRGNTALHYAARKGHAAVVEQLISAGATVDAANENGRGPGRVFGSFWEWLWRGDGRGLYIGADYLFFALGCWVVLVLVCTCCLRIHFCDGMGLLKFG